MRFKDFPVKIGLPVLAAALAIFVAWGEAAPGSAGSAPKRSNQTNVSDGGSCALCHNAGSFLPDRHLNTQGMPYKSCKPCHQGAATLRGKAPLSHLHMWNGLACKQCHGNDALLKAPAEKSCLACHGSYAAVARRTSGLALNPHQSHMGEIECGSCHKMHAKSENACNKCHNYDMQVP